MILKKQKIKEQTLLFQAKKELALREKYKLDLELFKLERELALPPSQFTESLYAAGLTYEYDEDSGLAMDEVLENDNTEI